MRSMPVVSQTDSSSSANASVIRPRPTWLIRKPGVSDATTSGVSGTPDQFAEGLGDLGAGQRARNDLDDLHQRHGIEEVQPQRRDGSRIPTRSASRAARTCWSRRSHPRAGRPPAAGTARLGGQVLADRLDDELHVVARRGRRVHREQPRRRTAPAASSVIRCFCAARSSMRRTNPMASPTASCRTSAELRRCGRRPPPTGRYRGPWHRRRQS